MDGHKPTSKLRSKTKIVDGPIKKLNEALFKETNAKDFSNQFFFHSKHIQSGKNGRWKNELSDNEINFLTNRYKEFIELFKLET